MKIACCYFKILLSAFVLCAMPCHASDENEIAGSAYVQDDGSLRISGNIIRLYGVYIPPTARTCATYIRPNPCGSRAFLALDLKTSSDFVHCKPVATNADGSFVASCSAGGDNLSEWLLQRGWAVALPNAPFEYSAMEKIAQSKSIGVWGIPFAPSGFINGSARMNPAPDK